MPDLDYQSLSAGDIIKMQIVEKQAILNQLFTDLLHFSHMSKSSRQHLGRFKAEVLGLYMLVRPKLLEYIRRNAYNKSKYESVTIVADNFYRNPLLLTTSGAMELYRILNEFCEDYKITSTLYYTGATRSEGGVF
jgi:hypothetical protein